MNKTQIIAAVADGAGMTKVQAENAVNAFIDAVSGALIEGDKVQIFGFGTFDVKEKGERAGVNPRTKEKITIAAAKRATFTPGKKLKDAVNK